MSVSPCLQSWYRDGSWVVWTGCLKEQLPLSKGHICRPLQQNRLHNSVLPRQGWVRAERHKEWPRILRAHKQLLQPAALSAIIWGPRKSWNFHSVGMKLHKMITQWCCPSSFPGRDKEVSPPLLQLDFSFPSKSASLRLLLPRGRGVRGGSGFLGTGLMVLKILLPLSLVDLQDWKKNYLIKT